MRQVLIVGAGPAGLAAATAARAAGAGVTLLDAADQLGGQYWRHLPAQRAATPEMAAEDSSADESPAGAGLLQHGRRRFQRLRAALEADQQCLIRTSSQVWAIERTGDGRPAVHMLEGPPDGRDRRRSVLTPDALILATGAHDRTLPFPGWDLPGVFSGGAAQALAKGERVAVGHRVVVAGAGPFLLPVAESVSSTGAAVVGVFEASHRTRLAAGWLTRPWKLAWELAGAGAGAKLGELAGYAGNQLRRRIPYRTGMAVVAAHGIDRVEAVTVARVDSNWSPVSGTQRRISADAVCVSHGFTPRLELAIAAGCALNPDRFVQVDADGRTSVPTVFAAGEITGIGGADAALAQGAVAGHCAAGGSVADPAVAAAVRSRARLRGFASRIERAHGIGAGWTDWLVPDTLICRCEDVSYRALGDSAAATAATGLRSVKLSSRAGLGICQGRICGRTVEELLADRGRAAGLAAGLDGASVDNRPIVSPIRMSELAAQVSAQPPGPSPTQSPEAPREEC